MSVRIIPKNAETAKALLDAAATAGQSPKVVVATSDAYVVPDEVADIYHHGGVKPPAEAEAEEPKPRKAATSSRRRKSAEKE